jgi:hypothetical protein
MPEKPTKKVVAITIKRERSAQARAIIATGFRFRLDPKLGVVDLILEAAGARAERIMLDPVLIRSNLESFKRYAANVTGEADDSVLKSDLPLPEHACYANMAHFSQMGERAETIFGCFRLADWVEATRAPQAGAREITSFDVLAILSTTGLQKKLILELVIALGREERE